MATRRGAPAMKKGGVPMLPGSDGPVESERRRSSRQGHRLSGHHQGGRRRRRPRHAHRSRARGLANLLRTAQREAEAAFGVGDVYIEKYLENPRHIEFQVLGDHHGNLCTSASASARSSAATRSCSRSRRSPLTDKIRRKMGSLVVDAAKAVQYTNAGTFEFLMDQDGQFYFMEANTRCRSSIRSPRWSPASTSSRNRFASRPASGLGFKQSE
jgi:acetyl-CoA carboxylase biotin carboxylase subunit